MNVTNVLTDIMFVGLTMDSDGGKEGWSTSELPAEALQGWVLLDQPTVEFPVVFK